MLHLSAVMSYWRASRLSPRKNSAAQNAWLQRRLRGAGTILLYTLGIGLTFCCAPRIALADGWALLIGIDQYSDSNRISSLGGAAADARALAKTLRDSAGFPEDHIKTLVSDGDYKPTRTNILNELVRLSLKAKAGDTVFVLYSGHGMDIDGVSYLLPYDTSALSDETITETAIETQKFHDHLRKVKAGAVILAFDMCRSDPRKSGKGVTSADNKLTHSQVRGLDLSAAAAPPPSATTTRDAKGVAKPPIAVTFYSCAEGERSYEWQEKGRGYFSFYLEAGLRGAASDKSGHVTVGSLQHYVESHVKTEVQNEEHSSQTPYPNLDGPNASEFVLATDRTKRAEMLVEDAHASLPAEPAAQPAPNIPRSASPSLHLHELLITLEPKSETVNAAVFSPDGKYIVTGSYDNNARMWDATTGALVRQLSHTGQVNAVAYSKDGQFILTGSDDGTAKLWNPLTGQLLSTFIAHKSGVTSVAISPDGKFAVTGSNDRTAKVWNRVTELSVGTLSGHTDGVSAVAFSPNGKLIVTASADKTAILWDRATGKLLKTLVGHTGSINAAEFSPDGDTILTGSADTSAILWDAATGRQTTVLSGHTKPIMAVSFSPNGKYIVTGSLDETVKVWEMSSGRELQTLSSLTGAIDSVAFSSDGKFIVTGSADHSVKVWTFTNGQTDPN